MRLGRAMIASDETAKAVAEVARTAHKALEITEKTGGFFNRVFGSLVEDGVGMIADRVRFYRVVQLEKLAKKAQSRLSDRAVTDFRHVPPSIGIPLIEAATAEDNDELHDRWSQMLANALDPKAPEPRRSFVPMLQQMEPVDARLLAAIHFMMLSDAPELQDVRAGHGGLLIVLAKLAERARATPRECEISLWNLERLGCIEFGINKDHVLEDPDPNQTISAHLTSLGLAFVQACIE